ncbi:MAG: sirohydrochlorin chelatase, partial [Nonomuraea sp.]|nr:sirohydrochlorin chelatase [Nonomuraea sp.]
MRHSPLTPGLLAGRTGPPTGGAGGHSPAPPAPHRREVPLVAVAHGSRDPRAAAAVEGLLELVRQATTAPVRVAYLDHSRPTLAEALDGLDEAVVLPLLLTEAYHSKVDLPAALNELKAANPARRIHYGTTLGPHPLMLQALERRLAEIGVTPDPDTAVVLVSAGSSDPAANAVIARMAAAWSPKWWAVSAAYASAADPTPEQAVAELRAAGAPRVVAA